MICDQLISVRTQDQVAMRDAYCETLIALAKDNPNILAIETDVMSSMGTAAFAKAFPDRSINCGIQEANAVGVASGLSLMGFIPCFHTFGIFATRRVFDQVFLSCGYAKANVKIVGGDAGVTAAANGGTHMPFEDLCLMRAVPDMIVVEPADTVSIRALVPQMLGRYGNTYMRCCRRQVTRVYQDGASFTLGKANLLREGSDVTIIACGILVAEALDAAEMLDREGISARVVDHFTVKPADEEIIEESARKTGAIVTVENHNAIGGLGSAVMEALARTVPVPVEQIGVKESFGEVGDIPYLMKRFGLTKEDICAAALRAIGRKKEL
jgi:transketolase